jgi:LacI family transcriptional regulator
MLRATDYPFVTLEKTQKTGRINSVCTDNSVGARLVTEHIKKLGYKNILIASDHKSARQDHSVIDELENALSLIPEINKPLIIELEKQTSDTDIDFGQFETFLRPPFRAEIVIVLHSNLVYPVMGLFMKKKLRVPQDIALISMEEGAGFEFMVSPVTCLRKPLPGMAIKVANMIWSEIKNSGKGKFKRQVNITPELVIRNSCGTI